MLHHYHTDDESNMKMALEQSPKPEVYHYQRFVPHVVIQNQWFRLRLKLYRALEPCKCSGFVLTYSSRDEWAGSSCSHPQHKCG